MSAKLGVLKGHTQAVLCAEVLSAQHLLATGGEVATLLEFGTNLLLREAGHQQS